MRDLTIKAGPWQAQSLPGTQVQSVSGESVPGVLDYATCSSDTFRYYRLGVEVEGEPYWYLYAMTLSEAPSLWVLGVFDTLGQVDFFLALHSNEPLWVPALQTLEDDTEWLQVQADGGLIYPHYAGIYRVGLKSYRVSETADPGIYTATYADRDHVEYLGQANEKEICLRVYSHFDARLRGCKLC